jgi:hypothetical protein
MNNPGICPRCSRNHDGHSPYCGFCGALIAIECPYCKARLERASTLCTRCGEPIKALPRKMKYLTAGIESLQPLFKRYRKALLVPLAILSLLCVYCLFTGHPPFSGTNGTLPFFSPETPQPSTTSASSMGWPMTGYDLGNTFAYPFRAKEQTKISDLCLLEEFRIDAIKSYAGAMTGDVNGDGEGEIVLTEGKELIVCSKEGKVLLRKAFPSPVWLNILSDINDDGFPEIVLSSTEGDTLTILVIEGRQGGLLRTIATKGQIRDGKPDSSISAVAVIDIDRDGKKEVLAMVNTGYGWKPRGVYVFDYESGAEKWHYATGPSTITINAADINNDGALEVIIGSYSPGNGNSESNGTDDMHCYVFALDCRGKELWIKELGGYFTGARTSTADINGDGTSEIIAFISTAFDFRQDEGKVLVLDSKGSIANSYETPYSIVSQAIADMNGDGRKEIVAGDRMGHLVMLNDRLEVLKKSTLETGSSGHDAYFININAAADIDGDGSPELICNAYEYEVVSGRNPRSDGGPRNVRHHHHNRVVVMSGDLGQMQKSFTIAELWKEPPGFRTIVSAMDCKGRNELIVLTDRISILGDRRLGK